MLLWRGGMRAGFTWHSYGWRQGLLAIPRMLVSNFIAVAAASRAFGRYRDSRAHGRAEWGKTAHVFPSELPAE